MVNQGSLDIENIHEYCYKHTSFGVRGATMAHKSSWLTRIPTNVSLIGGIPVLILYGVSVFLSDRVLKISLAPTAHMNK